MSDDYNRMSQKEINKMKRRRKVFILRILSVLIALILVTILGIIFFKIMFDKKERDKKAVEEKTTAAATTEEVASSGQAEIDEEEIEPNGDAAPIDEDSWMAGKTIYNPVTTDSTIHLPKADLEAFDQVISDSAGHDSSSEDAAGGSAWDTVTLQLDNVEGSINITEPDNPTKTQQLTSTYMILVDLDSDTIVAERDCEKVVSPASMTKVLTVLTARDFIDESNLDDTFVINTDITEYCRINNCSAVGFLPNAEVTVRDLLYGTILPSGADAAMGLAEYCCGDQETFVNAMNEKVKQLGLSETAHFTNVVGIYDEELHCTMKDMAIILGVAVQDDLLRDVLSLRTYTTDYSYYPSEVNGTTEQAEGAEGAEGTVPAPDEEAVSIEVSNWFLRKIEDKPMHGNVVAAKTGFVDEAGCCAVSYYEADNGKHYVCCTGNAFSSWRAIYDHVGVYRSLTP